ncbi:Zn(2)-C6 fungal-type DNA-binding domain protein [Metarhizium album ARSEF 1941]|uniref:Zn(2)-C6 fungal-type DNA-binding domain protein n=1 Tax=Metarhizium album (strain ARSEF 1941) TaxID=1081103 RepID=A0A0B2X2Q2_METAS|nr:Zn(2)-C6 fungal-type DNA-binding domain protein [Metarhizium album ARSEF 1941]KHO00579.1 Zn(2)-C6 fungal-type DNA-binding domain protein [Metarhizium album ARSEF 1941]
MANPQPAACKRYACDRCREHKLRCSRSSDGDSPCDRCFKFNALCVTSSARPVGRPSVQTSAGNTSTSHQHRRQLHGKYNRGNGSNNKVMPPRSQNEAKRQSNTCLHNAWRQDAHLLSPRSFPPSAAACSETSSGPAGGAPTLEDFEVMTDAPLDESDFSNDVSELGGNGFALDASSFQFQISNSANMAELAFGGMEVIPETENNRQGKNIMYATPDGTQDEGPAPVVTQPAASSGGDGDNTVAFMVVTIGNIIQELANLKNQPWKSWEPCHQSLMDNVLFNICAPEALYGGQPDIASSLAHVLGIATRFTWALQIMSPVSNGMGTTQRTPPTLSMKLMLLSTHIQLAQLFDTILTQTSGFSSAGLSEGRGHGAETDQSSSRGQRRPSQHVMMLTRVFEHHLHSVERLMGLPDESRLWSRKDSYRGILDQDEPSAVTQAVMSQAQDAFRSLKQTMDKMTGVISRIPDVPSTK